MGSLEIIDILCNVNARLSNLVSRIATEMEQANIADEVQKSIREEITQCEELTDRAESKLRRYRNGRD
ncbi:MAG: hypothetical protein IJ274_05455 [Lachnospiraceae bacterium]|nr:hypothetical protein [Lachnospiraceae bacterium]